MSKNVLKYITIIGLIISLFSCEKDGEKVIMLDNPIPPTIVSFPDLTLSADKASDTLVFIGTPVDLGFQASAKYYIEACPTGDNFTKPLVVIVSVQDTLLKTTVNEVNKILVKKFKAGTTTVDFRIRAMVVVDAGTGALGSSANPLSFFSETKPVSATLY